MKSLAALAVVGLVLAAWWKLSRGWNGNRS
jgi:hypothetical protein